MGLFNSTTYKFEASANHMYSVVIIAITTNLINVSLQNCFQFSPFVISNFTRSILNKINVMYANPKLPITSFMMKEKG